MGMAVFWETGWKTTWIRPKRGGSLVFGIGILVLDTPLEQVVEFLMHISPPL